MSDHGNKAGATAPPQVLVLGVGNILFCDNGFGVHMINALYGTELPANTQLLEAGTVSHQLIPLFQEVDHLIVVDAVETGKVPGSVFKLSPDDLHFHLEQNMSPHQISLMDVLEMTAITGKKPQTVIIGVQPKNAGARGLELSNELKAVIPQVKAMVLQELEKIYAVT